MFRKTFSSFGYEALYHLNLFLDFKLQFLTGQVETIGDAWMGVTNLVEDQVHFCEVMSLTTREYAVKNTHFHTNLPACNLTLNNIQRFRVISQHESWLSSLSSLGWFGVILPYNARDKMCCSCIWAESWTNIWCRLGTTQQELHDLL